MKKKMKREVKFGINELIVFFLLFCSAICVIFALISDSEKISVIFGAITVILTIIGIILTSTRFDKAKKNIVFIMFAIIVIGIVAAVIKISIQRDEIIQSSDKINESLNSENNNTGGETEIADGKNGKGRKNDNDEKNRNNEKKGDLKQENGEMEYEQLKWEEDIFVTNTNENIIEVLQDWVNNQTCEDVGLITKQKLNDGEYGKMISVAQKYYRDYQKSEMDDVKLFALDRGIELRKQANSISETCENMKELGTWLLQKSRLAKGEGNSVCTDNIDFLEQAIKYYIKALSMACASGSEKYSEALWKDLAYAYELWSMSGEHDEALRKRAKMISNACLKLSQ